MFCKMSSSATDNEAATLSPPADVAIMSNANNNSNVPGGSGDSKLVAFTPLPADQHQSYGATFLSYVKKMAGGWNKQSPKYSNSNSSPASSIAETGVPASEDTVFYEPDHHQLSDGLDDLPFPAERGIAATIKRIEYVLATQGSNIEQRREHWANDASGVCCHRCEGSFSAFRRRHHCRLCGYLFCSSCCNVRLPAELVPKASEPVKVCEHCHSHTISTHNSGFEARYLNEPERRYCPSGSGTAPSTTGNTTSLFTPDDCSGAASDYYFADTGDDLLIIEHSADKNMRHVDGVFGKTSLSGARKPAMGFLEENYATRERHWSADDSVGATSSGWFNDDSDNREFTNDLSVEQLQAIHRHAVHGPHRLPGTAHRHRLKTHHNCFLPNDIINWLLTNKYAANRGEAVSICRCLLKMDLISCVVPHQSSGHFSDGGVPYRLVTTSPPTFTTISGPTFSTANSPSNISLTQLTTAGVRKITGAVVGSGGGGSSQRLATVSYSKASDSAQAATTEPVAIGNAVDSPKPVTDSSEPKTPSQDTSNNVTDATEINATDVDSTASTSIQEDPSLSMLKESASPAAQMNDAVDQATIAAKLDAVWSNRVDRVLHQVLWWCGIDDSWAPTLWPIIKQVARTVSPDVRTLDDFMDIRRCIKFKKLPGGDRSECEVIDGVVASKTVACRGMSTRLSDPRLLLLADHPLLYPKWHLENINTVRQKEAENMRDVVTRIVSYRPHIVLVEGSLSFICQENLKAHGLTVVLGVKRSVLEAVERVTQAKIVNDLLTNTRPPELGFCHSFYTKTYDLPTSSVSNMDRFKSFNRNSNSEVALPKCSPLHSILGKENMNNTNSQDAPRSLKSDTNVKTRRKHLMYFTGCPAHLGCTIMLRGGTDAELRQVKNVVRFMIYVLYNWRFERSFLLQERALVVSKAGEGFINLEDYDQQQNDDDNEESECQKVVQTSNTSPTITGEAVVDCSDPLRNTNPRVSRLSTTQLIVDDLIEDAVAKNSFRQALNDVVICTSPYMKKMIPYLETEEGKTCCLRKYLPKILYYSKLLEQSRQCFSSSRSTTRGEEKSNDMQISVVKTIENYNLRLEIRERHPFVGTDLLTRASEEARNIALADFRASGEQLVLTGQCMGLQECRDTESFFTWESNERYCARGCHEEDLLMPWRLQPDNRITSVTTLKTQEVPKSSSISVEWGARLPTGELDCLHISNHQQLCVLFSSEVADEGNQRYCVNPCVLVLRYYGENDSPIGAFLSSYYFLNHYKCPKTTRTFKGEKECKAECHLRKFYHGDFCVRIKGHKVNKDWFATTRGKGIKEDDKQAIWMWNWCAKCKKYSATELVSPITWSLSLAKYLEIWLYAGGTLNKTSPRKNWTGAGLASADCPHPLHQTHHYQYFYSNERLAVVSLVHVPVRTLVFPPTPLPTTFLLPSKEQILEDLHQIAVKGYSFFEGILDKVTEDDVNTKTHLLRQKGKFKGLYDIIQLELTSHKFETGPHQANKSTGGIPPATMLSIQDKIVLLYRIVVESLNYWNKEFCKKDEGFTPTDTEDERTASDRQSSMSQSSPKTGLRSSDARGLENLEAEGMKSHSTLPSVAVLQGAKNSANASLYAHSIEHQLKTLTPPVRQSKTSPPVAGTKKQNVAQLTAALERIKQMIEEAEEKRKKKLSLVHMKVTDTTGETLEVNDNDLEVRPMVQNDGAVEQNDSQPLAKNEEIEETKSKDLPKDEVAPGICGSVDENDKPCQESSPKENRIVKSTGSHQYSETSKTEEPCASSQGTSEQQDIAVEQSNPQLRVEKLQGVLNSSDERSNELTIDSAREASECMSISPQSSPPKVAMAVPVFRAEKPVNADVKITEKIAEIKAADKMAEFKSFWSNFWRSSSSLELKYPFPTSCHYRGLEELCIPVMVNRDQLSSIMAHALASKQYYTKLKEKLTQILQYENPTPATAQTKTASPPCTHMMLNWTDHGTFTCLIYFSAEFHLLRRQILGENADEIFIRSLASSADWATKGGKSKSAFCKTIDNRFVLKEMKSIETEPIDQFCPAYFQHIMEAHNKNEPSALARIFGIFYVAYSKRNKGTKVSAASISDAASGGPPSPPPSSKPMYQTSGKVFMVMENLFYGHDLDKVYDLKGNTTNRTMKEDFSDEPGEIRVYLDNNLQIHRISNPLLVNPASTNVLPKAVERDTMFLADANIMDYSLLVGVTKDSGKNPSLVIGIIDFMRKFTHDKYLENIVKENLLRAEDPTIVSPEQYKKRFMRIIPSYFDAVPDSWSFLDMAKLSRMSEKCVKKGEIEEEWRRRENERGEHGDAALC